MKIAFIVNPIAGKNRKKDIAPFIKSELDKTNYEYTIIYTKGINDASVITKEYIDKKYEVIVAVGGDGTVREVASGISDENKGILGIIPMGTGNDLARTLNIPLDIRESIKRIVKRNIKEINIGISQDNIFLNVASIGFDAEIVENTKIFKGFLKGKAAYTMGILRTLFTFKSKNIKIEYDGIKRDENILLVAVANGRFYGGGMKICPKADITDNQLDVCIIKNIAKFKLLFLFPSVYNGKHGKYDKYVEFIRVSSLKIYSKNEVVLNVDGDIFKTNGLIDFNLDIKNLNIIV